MFETLQDRLGTVFDRLKGRGALSEGDVAEAMREVRIALLEADVALPVVRDFVARAGEKAVGQDVLRSVTPGQQVVKIVHDQLVEMLGSDAQGLDLTVSPPAAILMVGLQGSGKTTSSAKLALRLRDRHRKKVLLASLDTRRPAAMEQLAVLGRQAGIDTLPVIAGQDPLAIAKRAMTAGKLSGFDLVVLDSAGRTTVDEQLMSEIAAVKASTHPAETLLVADALTGQDAVATAQSFQDRVGLTGIVLTRVDGDGRGGAALSMRAVTGAPIKFVGLGEKLDAFEEFHPRRIAGRILGMGDVVGLVERAAETIDAEKAEKLAARMKKGAFDLDDLLEQLRQMRRMGGMQGVLSMLPGVAKMKSQLANAGLDDGLIKRQEAIILSMTRAERGKPDLLNASRRKRIARGSGTDVSEVNKLMKMHRQMADVMKAMGKGAKGKALMNALTGGAGGQMPPGMPGGLPGLGGMPPGLPGLPPGATLPGLGGPPAGRKK